jgi:WhiB family redox-sensing transcriptional regulator
VAQTAAAKAVCARCPVREPCLDWALETNQGSGVWGGMSEDERRAYRRSLARRPAGGSAEGGRAVG